MPVNASESMKTVNFLTQKLCNIGLYTNLYYIQYNKAEEFDVCLFERPYLENYLFTGYFLSHVHEEVLIIRNRDIHDYMNGDSGKC